MSELSTVAAPARPRDRATLIGAVLVLAGIIGSVFSIVGMAGLPVIPRAVVFFVSAGAGFRGAQRVAAGLLKRPVDLGLWLCITWIALLGLAAAAADVLPLAEHRDTAKTITVPGNALPDLFSENPLGTNNFALDLLSRSIYGARASLLTVSFAVVVSIIVGGSLGLVAGYFRGKVDGVTSILTDTILSVPPVVLLVALASVLGTPTSVSESAIKNGLALSVVGTPAMIRLARANSLVFSQREFVLAAKSMGAPSFRVLRKEVLPNVILPVISYAFIVFAVLVVAEGSLAYLGLGLQQPEPTWGNMIAEADFNTLRNYPHIMIVPSAFMFITVFSFNRVGERAREVWDPRDTAI